jgi:pilus assembly protein Flp/PilA
MLKSMVRLFKDEEGQGLVEYALILVLIALAVMAAMTYLKGGIGNAYNNAADALANTTT